MQQAEAEEEEDGMAGAQWKMSPYCSLSSLLSPGIKGDKSGKGKGRKGLNGEMITQPDSRLSLIALGTIVDPRSNSDADFLIQRRKSLTVNLFVG